jgi:hypothetical protein
MENINGPFLMIVFLYFWPTVAAIMNSGATFSDKLAAFVLNAMFGWTVIGWFFVYCYATSNHKGIAMERQAKANFYLREAAKHHSGNYQV